MSYSFWSQPEPKTGAPGKDELPVVYLSWTQWQELQARIAALETELARSRA